MTELERRREFTKQKKSDFVDKISSSKNYISDYACVCATGSYGRDEAGEASDLDLCIVSIVSTNSEKKKPEIQLGNLDEICLKADLIEAAKELKFPKFDANGRYLAHYTDANLIDYIGHSEDDSLNTFTSRLLLLLESSPIVDAGAYDKIIESIIRAYWKDYQDHKSDFVPAYLSNDILRLWRTFCVNYEARTSNESEEESIERKKKNYTLKHSRLLTCYSAIIYLLYIFNEKKSVSPEDAKKMTCLSPTERLEFVSSNHKKSRHEVQKVLGFYDMFLELKNDKDKLEHTFRSPDKLRQAKEQAYIFSGSVFDAVEKVGNKSKFHKMILV